jgi:hypothetical protein
MDALPAAFEDVLAAVEAAAVAAVDPVPEIVELMVVSRVSEPELAALEPKTLSKSRTGSRKRGCAAA